MVASIFLLCFALVLAECAQDDKRTEEPVTSSGLSARYQFPYMVSIEREWMVYRTHACGGTIISRTHVLTASHCRRAYGTYVVVAGIRHLEEVTGETQTRNVAKFVSQSDLKENNEDTSRTVDVEIVIVESPFTWSEAVQPVYLPELNEQFTGTAILSGWGDGEKGYTLSLRYSTKNLISLSECAAIMNSMGNKTDTQLDDNNICTSNTKSMSTCIRDPGSALVKNGVLVGVVSRGILTCGLQNGPTVYTRSASLINWIQSYVSDLP